jgi:predicted nucleic acid-binding protein
MNIYCETNFFLEIVFSQEQSKYCEKIISLGEKKKIKIIIPAYSFAEALYKLEAQRKKRESFQRELNSQISQLAQTSQYNSQITNFRTLDTFLTQNIEEEKKRFEKCRKSLTKIAEIIAFDALTIEKAKPTATKYDLTLQDAIIFSSILNHLRQNNVSQNCFLNRNSKDFSQPSIVKRLKTLNCKFFADFEKAYNFIDSQIK